jgi:hypothetical protein
VSKQSLVVGVGGEAGLGLMRRARRLSRMQSFPGQPELGSQMATKRWIERMLQRGGEAHQEDRAQAACKERGRAGDEADEVALSSSCRPLTEQVGLPSPAPFPPREAGLSSRMSARATGLPNGRSAGSAGSRG